MIQIKDLSVSFSEKQVLKNIDIRFNSGWIHGIVGLNGSGKTTFFNSLTGVVKLSNGQILFNDKPFHFADASYLETNNYFYSRLTGSEYLKIFEQTNSSFNLDVLQHFFELPLDELIDNYSTGMKKKLALLCLLKQDRPVYLLDEPFNSLDMETIKVLEQIILILKEKGKTLFISSHIIDPLLKLCDEIHYLTNGRFSKTYKSPEFASIENDLFSKIREDAKQKLGESI